MSPTQPPLPGAGPSTREIPVVPPTANGATAADAAVAQETTPPQSAAAALGPQPTGPVDYVPGPPPPGGPATAPAPAVATPPERDDFLGALLEDSPRRRDPQTLRRLGATVLVIAAVVLLELGLAVHEAGRNLWSDVPLWSAFATLAALLGLATLATALPGGRRLAAGRAWTLAAAGLAGLAVFWLLVVLPSADTDRGFVLTAALACLGGGVWLTAQPGSGRAAASGTGDEEPTRGW